MSTHSVPFDYPESLQQYMVTASDFCAQYPQYHILATGAVIFDSAGKMLLVRRAETEKAFPNFWEIPGGKVDDTDETILHAVAREVKEETGLDVTRIVRKVGEFGWEEYSKRRARQVVWHKVVFEVEVKSTDTIVLDPVEHQDYLFAAQDEIVADQTAAGVPLTWITLPNKEVNVEAFRLRQKEAAPAQRDPATRIL